MNLTLHSLFRQADLLLQGKLISPDIGLNYPYKSIFDVLLNYGYSAKDSQLQSELDFKDTTPMDGAPGSGGYGVEKRFDYTKAGLAVSMEGPLHLDICQQKRPMLNGVRLTLKLYPHFKHFVLMSSDKIEYEAVITQAKFKICYVKLNDAVLLAQDQVLRMSPALYPFWKSTIKTFSLSKGSASFDGDDLFHGKIPSKLIVALVRTEAYTGSFKYNPFNFITGGVNYISFTVNGNSVPQEALQPNFATGDYVTSFLTLFRNRYPHHQGNFITRHDYPNGYTIYLFDIQGQTDEELLPVKQSGLTNLTIRFSAETTAPLTVITYACFPETLKCDHSRNIFWT